MAAEDWVGIEIPEAFLLGPKGFAKKCGWQIRKDADRWRISTDENYYRTSPTLVQAAHIGSAKDGVADAAVFSTWPPHDPYIDEHREMVGAEVKRLIEAGKREEFWEALTLAFKEVKDSELPEFVSLVLQNLRTQLPNSSVWAVTIDPNVFTRTGAARSLFAGLETPEAIERAKRTDAFEGFKGLQGLQTSTMYGLESFFDVAFMVAAPWLIGIGSARVGGYIAVLFGSREIGKAQRPAAELLQLYQPSGFAIDSDMEKVSAPEFSPEEASQFFGWWVEKVNAFLAVLLDPSNFLSRSNTYDPRQHVAAIVSVERLFSSVQGVLAHTRRDNFARLLYFFTVLDQLEGMRHRNFKELTRLPKVRQDLAAIEAESSSAVQAVLLPKLRRAVSALEDVGKGFHLEDRRTGETIKVKGDRGWAEHPVDTAAAHFLRLLRNSTHSFASMALDPGEISLLAAHDGTLSPWLPDLALLHLVRFVISPTALLPVAKRRRLGTS